MQVWDTAGQERFRTITQSYYRSAHGAMVAYDITRRATFESVSHWIREVEHYGAASVVLILIGEQNTKFRRWWICSFPSPRAFVDDICSLQVTSQTFRLRGRCFLKMRAHWRKAMACWLSWKPQPKRPRTWTRPSPSWPGSCWRVTART